MPGVLQLRLLGMIRRRTRRPYVPKRRRECQDPFQVYTDKEFKQRFRMSKEGVGRLHAKLLEHLQPRSISTAIYGTEVISRRWWRDKTDIVLSEIQDMPSVNT